MGGLIPLGDASRRPVRIPVVTAFIILVNVIVFGMEVTQVADDWPERTMRQRV